MGKDHKKRKPMETVAEMDRKNKSKQSSIERHMSPSSKEAVKTSHELSQKAIKEQQTLVRKDGKKSMKRKHSELSMTSNREEPEQSLASHSKKQKMLDSTAVGSSQLESEAESSIIVDPDTLSLAKKGAPDDGSGWSKEETLELVSSLLALPEVLPKENLSFRRKLNYVKLDGVGQAMQKHSRSVEECKARLAAIVCEVAPYRNLHQILSCYEYNKPSKMARQNTPLSLYLQEHKGSLIEEHGMHWMSKGSSSFKELSEQEKKPYMDAGTRGKDQEVSYARKEVFPPYHFYGEKHAKNVTGKELRTLFYSLPAQDKRRIKAISKSLKSYKEALIKFEEKRKAHPSIKFKPPRDYTTKAEYKEYLESFGMPSMEVESAYQLYQRDCPSAAKDGTNLSKYRAFTLSDHYESYKAKFQKVQRKYTSAFQSWLDTHDTVRQDVVLRDKAKELHAEVLRHPTEARPKTKTKAKTRQKSPKAPKAPKPLTTRAKVRSLEERATEPPAHYSSHFPTEPSPRPLSARECFAAFTRNVTPANGDKWHFKCLSAEHKAQLEGAAKRNATEYKKQLLTFLNGLADDARKMYLGQHRIKLLKLFEGEDIFEDDYPVEDYPPYRQSSNKGVKAGGRLEKTLVELMAEISSQDEPLATSTPMVGAVKTKPGVAEAREENNHSNEGNDGLSEDESEGEEQEEQDSDNEDSGHEDSEYSDTEDYEVYVKKRQDSHKQQKLVAFGKKVGNKELQNGFAEGSSEDSEESSPVGETAPKKSNSQQKEYSSKSKSHAKLPQNKNVDQSSDEDSGDSSDETVATKSKSQQKHNSSKTPQSQKQNSSSISNLISKRPQKNNTAESSDEDSDDSSDDETAHTKSIPQQKQESNKAPQNPKQKSSLSQHSSKLLVSHKKSSSNAANKLQSSPSKAKKGSGSSPAKKTPAQTTQGGSDSDSSSDEEQSQALKVSPAVKPEESSEESDDDAFDLPAAWTQ